MSFYLASTHLVSFGLFIPLSLIVAWTILTSCPQISLCFCLLLLWEHSWECRLSQGLPLNSVTLPDRTSPYYVLLFTVAPSVDFLPALKMLESRTGEQFINDFASYFHSWSTYKQPDCYWFVCYLKIFKKCVMQTCLICWLLANYINTSQTNAFCDVISYLNGTVLLYLPCVLSEYFKNPN